MKRLNRVIEGLTTVSFGLVLLANSAGVLSWHVWLTLLSLWPLLLIAIGIDIIGKGAKQDWLRVVSSLVVLGGLGWVVLVGPAGGLRWDVPWGNDTASYSYSEPNARNVTNASIDISMPLSTLSVSDTRRGLVSVEADTPYEPEFDTRRVATRTDITLDSQWDGPVVMSGDAPRAAVLLGTGTSHPIAWDITVDTAAADCEIDLSELSVSGVDVSAGVALVDLTLGMPATDSGDVPVIIDAGIIVANIRLPEGAEFLVDSGVGLGSVDVERGVASSEGTWRSSGYDRADDRYIIRATGGMGSVDVTYY